MAREHAVDFIAAGAGPLVVLVHASLSSAHQWNALTRDLEHRFHVRAVNLFGYGDTPAWAGTRPPSLDDFAGLVARAVPDSADEVHLVGHSFGGAVAMQAAARQLRGRVTSLVLIEPSLFYLLDRGDRRAAFDEIAALGKDTKQRLAEQRSEAAAELFIDYWCGAGTWAASPPGRKSSIARAIARLPHEWDAVLTGKTTAAQWGVALPRRTLLMRCVRTARPSREIVELLSRVRPDWEFAGIPAGGHMAPVTHPNLVNPLVRAFMAARRPAASNESQMAGRALEGSAAS
jgi:pimeloyl-ACP methyl ester carboxylesterase